MPTIEITPKMNENWHVIIINLRKVDCLWALSSLFSKVPRFQVKFEP